MSITRRTFLSASIAIPTALLTGCSISNGADANIGSIINTSVEADSNVTDSQINADYGKNRITGTEHVNLSGTINYRDILQDDLDLAFRHSLIKVRDALNMSHITKGDVEITAVCKNKKLSVSSLLDTKHVSVDDLSSLKD